MEECLKRRCKMFIVLLLILCEFAMEISYMKLINDTLTKGADSSNIIMLFTFSIVVLYLLMGVLQCHVGNVKIVCYHLKRSC